MKLPNSPIAQNKHQEAGFRRLLPDRGTLTIWPVGKLRRESRKMIFPREVWKSDEDITLVEQMLDLFAEESVIVTDELSNTVYFSPVAEKVFQDRGEAIVNRAAYSLLGFDRFENQPKPLVGALLGKGEPWRGAVILPGQTNAVFCEASAIKRGDEFVCGIIRLGTPSEVRQAS